MSAAHEEEEDPFKMPMISFVSLERARTTIEDFTLSYFGYHALRLPEAFLKNWPTLVYVEGVIYEMDEQNEQLAGAGITSSALKPPAAMVLESILEKKGLLDEDLQMQLNEGYDYWASERFLCAAMLEAAAAPKPVAEPAFSVEDVHKASLGKSFDYRVLHLLLHRLHGRAYERRLLAFLRVDEHLVDIGDDLVDYEDDVCSNSFNIFRAYVYLYGEEAALKLANRISSLESEHRNLLQALPAAMQEHYWSRHRQASAIPGSEKWVFPTPILDEQCYRTDVATEAR